MERRLTRRSFFGALGAAAVGAAALVVDPDRLLWTPGKKTIFVPPPTGWGRPQSYDLWFGEKIVNANPSTILSNAGPGPVMHVYRAGEPPMWIVPADYEPRLLEQLRQSLSLPRAYLEMPTMRVGDTVNIRMPERYFTSQFLSAKGSLSE